MSGIDSLTFRLFTLLYFPFLCVLNSETMAISSEVIRFYSEVNA